MGFPCSLNILFTLDSGKEEGQQISVGLLLPSGNEMAHSPYNSSNQLGVSMFSWNTYFCVSISNSFRLFFFFLFTNTMFPSNWGAPQSWSICTDKIGTHWDSFFSRKPDMWRKTGSLGNHPGAGQGFSWATLLIAACKTFPQRMLLKVESPRTPVHSLCLMVAEAQAMFSSLIYELKIKILN